MWCLKNLSRVEYILISSISSISSYHVTIIN